MPKSSSRPKGRSGAKGRGRNLMVRLDEKSKTVLKQAAELRGISVSDYVRVTTVAQARREVAASREQTIVLTPEEQLAFWNALQETPEVTPAQRELGALIRSWR